MNRIYQGRVTKVDALYAKDTGGEPTWQEFPEWRTVLWRHHELFQDAVNYYMLALAAMGEGVDAGGARDKAILDWRKEVERQWQVTTRKAHRYAGPGERLARWLGLNPNEASFATCAKALLKASSARPDQRAAALLQLLDEAATTDLNHLCVDRLPFLCTERAKFGATSKAVSSLQVINRQKTVRKFRDLPDEKAIKQAPDLDLGLFLTQPPTKLVIGDEAAKMLGTYWEKVAEQFPTINAVKEEFFASLTGVGDALRIPSLGRKPSGLYPIAAVFRTLPCAETLAAFRQATHSLCEAKDKTAMTDALADVRINDSPVFDYFTNRVFHREPADEQRAAWFEFDLAAFIEAVKAPHRYFQDTQKREAVADKLRAELMAMESQGRAAKADGSDGEQVGLDGFLEDSRIQKIIELVFVELTYLADVESAGDEVPLREFISKSLEAQNVKLTGGQREYTIRERTLRGWNIIRDKWRVLAEKGEASPDKLWAVVASEQAAHRDDFGSSMLYKKLSEPHYHTIWRDKGTRDWHADDPLRVWLQYTGLRLDLADKTRPIRFTPAHPVQSPRFFIFPKSGRWGSKHETGTLAFTAGIAICDDEKWRSQMMRWYYAAPRLRRDELRRPDEASLESAPWLQPMMKALGLPEPAQQDFGNCRITLQPAGPDDIQLTFPVEVESAKLIAQIGKQARWSRQFNLTPHGDEFRDASLRWPHERKPNKPPAPWHGALDSFLCLSVDLGQRDAGAYALLDVRANQDFGKKPSRFIGETPGKKWRAALAASGLLRLSGEDREEWRAKTSRDVGDGDALDFREELHGSRGRMPRDFESEGCRALLNAFLGAEDAKTFLPAGWDDPECSARLSFPEQNDKLLVAARRAQSRVARLHRWCWFLGDDKKRGSALTEIRDSLNASGNDAVHWLPDSLKEFAATDNDPRLPQELSKLLEARLKELPGLLEQLANRILPMRGRSWKWGPHPGATNENRIFLLTQNGPSLASRDSPTWVRGQRGLSTQRIEQIEELRKRFQSLNQTLRRDVGGPPPIRRDESVPDPCPDLLERLDNLKEQRVNQTAHMILAEALGVRLANPPADKVVLKRERDQHGIYKKFREPVDFIVIEDLSRYRASQGRAPRENSRLMRWCHRAVCDKLRELREPFGIPVLETPAAYSSRFCSRTGVPGFRAVEVTAGFENEAPWCWLKEKKSDGKLTEEAEFIRRTAADLQAVQNELETSWKPKLRGQKPPRRTLLLPQAGGPIFVPVVDLDASEKLRSAVVQADVNAAINLGLRAISDPRLWDIHPRVRTERLGGDVRKRSSKKRPHGTASATATKPEETVRLRTREKRKYGESGPELSLSIPPKGSAVEDTRNPNYFFDVAGVANWDKAAVPDPQMNRTVSLSSGKAFWSAVKVRQWQRCREINIARLRKWNMEPSNGWQTSPATARTHLDDDIPL